MVKIKAEYNNTVIAFGSNGAVLSKRSQSELIDLAIITQDSQNPNLKKLFVELPSIDDLRKMKMDEKIREYKSEQKIKTKNTKVETTRK